MSYVIVSGAPGSGKTTLARALAERLHLPLLSKDTFKEALMDVLEVPDLQASQRIGLAAIKALYAVAADTRCGVLESVWLPALAVPELSALPGDVVEVFCRCPAEVARGRYASRADARHRGHFDGRRLEDDLWESVSAEPVGGPWPMIEVDTTTLVDVERLAAQIVDPGPRTS